MLITNLFESVYGPEAGVRTIEQLLRTVKHKEDTDLQVGPELFPITYGDARYLLSIFKANREDGNETLEYFGNANWIETMLAKRDETQSAKGMNERRHDIDKDPNARDHHGYCPVTGKEECHCDESTNEMKTGGKHSAETLAKMSGDNHHSAWKKDKTTDEYKKKRKAQRIAYYKKKKEEERKEELRDYHAPKQKCKK
jgi:hypothetical protein